MKLELTSEQINRLLEASTYRAFIGAVIEIRSASGRTFKYSDIARQAGFSARSFPREVTRGTRRLTPASVMPFARGLGLSGDWVDYFKLLVELEEEDCRDKVQDSTKLVRMLQNLTVRLRQKQKPLGGSIQPRDLFFSHHVPLVYAALGSKETGATVAAIRKRTGLENDQILPILSEFVKSGVATKSGLSYFAKELHLNLTGLPATEVYRSFYLHLLSEAALNARTRFNSDRHLFFSSSFSVTSRNLPKLKEELRSLLLRFTDSSEVSDGDQVISVAASLF